MYTVDLTHSDDEGERPRQAKRRKLQPTEQQDSDSDCVILRDYDDSDVEDVTLEEVLSRRQREELRAEEEAVDDDLVITGMTGKVATRDMAHSRPDCAQHRFKKETAASNGTCCDKCFCYVCDVPARECKYWGTGAQEVDHANARPVGPWTKLRESSRMGKHKAISNHYNGIDGRTGKPRRSHAAAGQVLSTPARGAAEAEGNSPPSSRTREGRQRQEEERLRRHQQLPPQRQQQQQRERVQEGRGARQGHAARPAEPRQQQQQPAREPVVNLPQVPAQQVRPQQPAPLPPALVIRLQTQLQTEQPWAQPPQVQRPQTTPGALNTSGHKATTVTAVDLFAAAAARVDAANRAKG